MLVFTPAHKQIFTYTHTPAHARIQSYWPAWNVPTKVNGISKLQKCAQLHAKFYLSMKEDWTKKKYNKREREQNEEIGTKRRGKKWMKKIKEEIDFDSFFERNTWIFIVVISFLRTLYFQACTTKEILLNFVWQRWIPALVNSHTCSIRMNSNCRPMMEKKNENRREKK